MMQEGGRQKKKKPEKSWKKWLWDKDDIVSAFLKHNWSLLWEY